MLTSSKCVVMGSRGLLNRESDLLRVWVSCPAGIVSGKSECPVLAPLSIPRLRWDPWARHRTPNCSPGAAALAAHCSGCVFTVCVCVCLFTSHCCVCVHLDRLNAEPKFQVWNTILGHTSFPFPPSYTHLCKIQWQKCFNSTKDTSLNG